MNEASNFKIAGRLWIFKIGVKSCLSKIENVILICFILFFNLAFLQTTKAQNVDGQKKLITGVVADTNGETLLGVNVIAKGTTIGTITDETGSFSIQLPESVTTLIFSSIGLTTVEVDITDMTTVNITMEESFEGLDEVVVVGYGTQKKATATGAIATVDTQELIRTPVANMSQAIVGLVPGISAVQFGGEPGRNEATIRIRGVSTLSTEGQDVLIVIDGLQRELSDFNSLDPNDIESLSVLKDASATAVYGIRGANGVIIVTTKRGKTGEAKINLTYNRGITKAREILKPVNSYEYALYRNEAIANDGVRQDLLFSEDEIWKFQNNRDYRYASELDGMGLTQQQIDAALNSPALYYGSHNYFKDQYSGVSPQSQLNVNISGGTEDVGYYASIGYFQQDGIFDFNNYGGLDNNSHYDRYNFRTNVDIRSVKNLTISLNLSATYSTTEGIGFGDYWDINQWLYESAPFKGPGIIDGRLVTSFVSSTDPIGSNRGGGGRSPIIEVFGQTNQSIVSSITSILNLQYNMDYLTKGLSVGLIGSYNDNQGRRTFRNTPVPLYTAQRNPLNPSEIQYFGGAVGAEGLGEDSGSGKNRTYYVEGKINYERTFGDHGVSALLIGNGQKYFSPDLLYNVPRGLLGFASRLTYNYKEKYLAEFNMGYNGSENFPKGKRFGFFPAVSAGWVISNEKFFENIEFISWLKLRGSYGIVGNDRIGGDRFLFLPSTWNNNVGGVLNGYYFGFTNGSSTSPYYTGALESKIGNPLVTWETSTKRNISLETRFLDNRFSFTIDLWDEKRTDILWELGTIPAIVGADLPAANIGKVNNHGYDIDFSWRDDIGKFGYKIRSYVAYAKNTVIYKDEAAFEYNWMNETGFSLGQYKGNVSDGFFNQTSEVNNRMYSSIDGNQFQTGDLRYVDINGDGILDAADKVPIGNSNLPLYSFGTTIAFNIGGFDMSLLFTGSFKGSFPIRSENLTTPFFKDHGVAFQWQYDGRWTPEKVAQGITPTFPRAAMDNNSSNNGASLSDFWLRSNDHIKLKNIEIGYNFKKLAQTLNVSKIRVYANANNVVLIKSDFIDGMDPEQLDRSNASRGFLYPMTSSYVGGVKIEL